MNYFGCLNLIWESLHLDILDHNYGINRGLTTRAIETNDNYHGDLPQCGYYRAAGKIFACRVFKWRNISLPSQSARLTPYRYIESLRPHCGPACEGGTICDEQKKKKINKTGRNLVMCIVATRNVSKRFRNHFYDVCKNSRAVTKTRWYVYRA